MMYEHYLQIVKNNGDEPHEFVPMAEGVIICAVCQGNDTYIAHSAGLIEYVQTNASVIK